MRSYIKVYFKSFFKGIGFLMGVFLILGIVNGLDIQTDVSNSLKSYIKKMYFTDNGKSPLDELTPHKDNNTTLLFDGQSGNIDMIGALNIQEGKLKDGVIISQDVKDYTINKNNIGNFQINNNILADNSIDSSKISIGNIKNGNIKNNTILPIDINSSDNFEFKSIYDNDNPAFYSDQSKVTNFNTIKGDKVESLNITKVNTGIGVLKGNGSSGLNINGSMQVNGDLCRKFSHPDYGQQDNYCLGNDPLEFGIMQEGGWCKVSGNKINCNNLPPYTFSWKIGAYGGCNTSCGSGIQTRTIVCERNDN
ncbi:MAG: thrombospondin type-1 domain-containing protein, partial [Candidatus Absconditabacteria bacterium]